MAVTSCSNEDDLTTVSVSDTQTDMEVLSRFIDVNEATNEYYINAEFNLQMQQNSD